MLIVDPESSLRLPGLLMVVILASVVSVPPVITVTVPVLFQTPVAGALAKIVTAPPMLASTVLLVVTVLVRE